METPLYIVREDARVERLGSWVHRERRLVLERAGFPFLGPGEHVLEDDLPWIFWDMAPSGYMGAKFARKFPELRLPENPQHWSAEHALRALAERGEDLSGNLIVGETSRSRFFELSHQVRTKEQFLDDGRQFAAALEESVDTGGSSLGGDRPKIVIHGTHLSGTMVRDFLVKFTPPLESAAGRRWANLLRMEELCARLLRDTGMAAAASISMPFLAQRGLLGILRFDRNEAGGRVGASTLSWLAASRGEAEQQAPAVLASLHRDGLLDEASVATATLLHAFSAAIGNTDAHLGNYGLLFDAGGRATLAPAYDVLPMALAPRHDELPDARLKPRATPVDPRVEGWLARLVTLVRESPDIDQPFKDLWFRYIGA